MSDTTIARALRDLDLLHSAWERVIDLTETNDALLAENCRLRGELARACNERDEARLSASYLQNPRK
jgi:hypothetical protein